MEQKKMKTFREKLLQKKQEILVAYTKNKSYGKEADEELSIRMIHRALDAGLNFLDTANVYSRGRSEEVVGKALAGVT